MPSQTDNTLRLGAVLLATAFANIWFQLVQNTVPDSYLVSLPYIIWVYLNDYCRMKSSMFVKQKIMSKGIGMFGIPK